MAGDDFLKLYWKFKAGLEFIRGAVGGGTINPFLEKEIFRFVREVVDPMDRAWEKIAIVDRRRFLKKEAEGAINL